MKIPLAEIKKYLSENEVPTQLKLDDCTFISDSKTFIDNHISTLERNTGNPTFKPYYDRLCDFYNKVKKDR